MQFPRAILLTNSASLSSDLVFLVRNLDAPASTVRETPGSVKLETEGPSGRHAPAVSRAVADQHNLTGGFILHLVHQVAHIRIDLQDLHPAALESFP